MSIARTMNAAELLGHGGLDMLVWRDDVAVPVPKPDEVLVRVLAAGVNNTDINTRIGWYSKDVSSATSDVTDSVESGGWAGALAFPLIQGGDLCGEAVALGSDVAGISIGMRVTSPINQPDPAIDAPTRFQALGSEYNGAFAQYCCVKARHLFDVSASPLSDIEIGAMPCAYGTALNLLTRSHVASGDDVLITGASGGVGLAAIQLAKLKGANVTGVTSKTKAESVRNAGADAVIERNTRPNPNSFDVVIDVVGGDGFPALLDSLRPAGRYAVSGAIAGPIVSTDLRVVYLNDLTLIGCTYQPVEIFEELVALINAGAVRPLVSKTYDLQDIAIAQADFAAKKHPGKLVLIP